MRALTSLPIRARGAAVAALGLMLAVPALAKSPKKMTDGELLDYFNSDEKVDKRVDAAAELGARRLVEAISSLERSCDGDEATLCAASLDALASYNSSDAWDSIQVILERAEVGPAERLQALNLLLDGSPGKIAESAFPVLSTYRSLDPSFGVPMLQAVQSQGVSQVTDVVMYISLDEQADRSVRIAALDAAEAFNHPRLFEAFLSMLDDSERSLRVRCTEGLDREGLPSSRLLPALEDRLKNDLEGSVRAAAVKALWHHAHPQLLPTLYNTLLEERHPFTWENALPLMLALADETAVEPVSEALVENQRITSDDLLQLIELLQRLNDPEAIVELRALEQRQQGTELAERCREVANILEMKEIERPEPPTFTPHPDITFWDPEVPDPTFPELRVDLQNNVLVWIR